MAPPSLPTTGFFPITGIQAGLDPNATDPLRKVPQRMDLDDWYLSTETVHVNQRALFFPAFKNFSEASSEDKFSYFQLAGIHGFPIVPWDETVGEAGTRWSYCHHGETTFATWHRPYLMLFEVCFFLAFSFLFFFSFFSFSVIEHRGILTLPPASHLRVHEGLCSQQLFRARSRATPPGR